MKKMFRSVFVVLGLFGMMNAGVAAELKVASVDMQKLFNEYHGTKTAQEQLKVDQAAIQKDNAKRLEGIRALQEEIDSLTKKRNDATISDGKRLDIEREIKLKLSEGNAADNERRQWLGRKNQALTEHINDQKRVIIGKIKELVTSYARAQNFDLVIDKSAVGVTQVDVFIFSKDQFDVTEAILKDLNKDAPKPE